MGLAQQRQRVGTPRRRRPSSEADHSPFRDARNYRAFLNTNYVVSLNSPIVAPDKK